MFKILIPTITCSFIIMNAASSFTASKNSISITENEENSFLSHQKTKLERISMCESDSVSIYFNQDYLTHHSAQFLNDALESSSNCKVADIKILIYEDNEENLGADEIKDELNAYMKAHGVAAVTEYKVRGADMTAESLNGRVAKVNLDVSSQSTSET